MGSDFSHSLHATWNCAIVQNTMENIFHEVVYPLTAYCFKWRKWNSETHIHTRSTSIAISDGSNATDSRPFVGCSLATIDCPSPSAMHSHCICPNRVYERKASGEGMTMALKMLIIDNQYFNDIDNRNSYENILSCRIRINGNGPTMNNRNEIGHWIDVICYNDTARMWTKCNRISFMKPLIHMLYGVRINEVQQKSIDDYEKWKRIDGRARSGFCRLEFGAFKTKFRHEIQLKQFNKQTKDKFRMQREMLDLGTHERFTTLHSLHFYDSPAYASWTIVIR